MRGSSPPFGRSDVVGVSKAERTDEPPERQPNSVRRPVRTTSPRANLQPLVQKREVAAPELLSVEARRLATMATLTRADLGSGRGLTYEWEFFVDQLFRNQTSGGGGGGGGSATFEYDQPTAASVWTINHGLSAFPSVVLVDLSGQELHAELHYPDDQKVVVMHGQPYSGTAYLRA